MKHCAIHTCCKSFQLLRSSLFIDRKGWSANNIWIGVKVELPYICTNSNHTHRTQKIWIHYQWTLRTLIFMRNYKLSSKSKRTHSFALCRSDRLIIFRKIIIVYCVSYINFLNPMQSSLMLQQAVIITTTVL
jgi:hypothetical protein